MKDDLENSVIKSTAKSVVFFGDSITEFWKDIDNGFFSDDNYINKGISGQTTSQMLHRFHQDVINLKPSIVVILAGINDIAENCGPISLEEVLENIITIVKLAQANTIQVILCSVLPANNFYWNPKIKPAEKVIELNKMIKEFSESNNIKYVDYFSKMVNKNNGLDKKYGDDGVHPNIEGYSVMKSIITNFI